MLIMCPWRKGAFKELLKATDVLIENGIAPRYQAFINQENKDDVVKLLNMIEERKLKERCDSIGIPFEFFVHEGSCDGENQKLYDIRICKNDIPEELIKYYLGYDEVLSEKECCERLKDDSSYVVYHNEDHIILNITSNYDVYYNFTHISPNWKIGNLKTDEPWKLAAKIINEDTYALNLARNITVGELVKRYGNAASERVFAMDDYKSYLLNCFVDECEI